MPSTSGLPEILSRTVTLTDAFAPGAAAFRYSIGDRGAKQSNQIARLEPVRLRAALGDPISAKTT